MKRHGGFSLIELTAVLVIMALLGGVISVAVARRLGKAHEGDVLDRAVRVDVEARRHAVRYGERCALTWSAYERFLIVQTADEQVVARCQVPDDWIVQLLRLADDQELGEVVFETDGRTPTYVVEFQLADGSYRRLLFAGVTGQVQRCDALEDYRRYAELLSGNDAY